MSCFERGDKGEIFNPASLKQGLLSHQMTCVKTANTSPPASSMTKATSSTDVATVTLASKRNHCRPHIAQQADELTDLLEEALVNTCNGGRWIKNPLKSHPPPPAVYSSGGMKFHHLSTSNYEKAREIDMNFAEIDMETFNTKDIDMALRLAHSSPINDSMIRLCGDTEGSCILMNSLYYPMDRSKESLFKDEMLFSRTGDMDSLTEKSIPKSCLMNVSTALSDSFDTSEDENKDLVNKCNTTDKTQYTIAFDSNESRYGGHNMVASNFDYLTSSIYNSTKNRLKIGKNGNTESPVGNDTVESDDTLSYHTLSNHSPHSTLNTHTNSNFRETFLPIYDLKASSISPDSNHSLSTTSPKSLSSHRNTHQSVVDSPCEEEQNRHNLLNSTPKQCNKPPSRDSLHSNFNCNPYQAPSVIARASSNIISPCSLLPPVNSHELQQHLVNTVPPHLQHLYENRLKYASPIREEDEPSTDSSRADVDMVSDSEKGTPSSTSDSSPLAPPGKCSLFNATASRSGPWSSSQIGSEFSSDTTNRSEVNRNSNLRMSAGFASNGTRASAASGSECRQNMAEWLRKTSVMSSPRGFQRPGGSEPPTPVNATYQMWPGYHATECAMRSPFTMNTGGDHNCHRHHYQESRCCYGHHSDNPPPPQPPPPSSLRHHRWQNVDSVTSSQALPSKETIYVCYPNYSLPDLSFLASPNAKTPMGDVCLSPTKPLVRPLSTTNDKWSGSSVTSHASTVSSRASTLKGAPRTRPKSFNDVDTLTKSALAKVKDWDSISFLLPPEFKAILGAKGLVPASNGTSLLNQPDEPAKSGANAFASSATVHQVKLRPRSTALPGNKSKRYSLQEPVQMKNNSPGYAYGTSRIGLVRSETLPENAAYYSGHIRSNHPNCVVNNTCCHHYTPPPPAACCHRHDSSFCCDSTSHRQLINREDYIETLKELLAMQETEKEVGLLLGALSPSLEKKCSLNQTITLNTTLVKDDSSFNCKPTVVKSRATVRPSKMILKSPGEKPTVPPKPTSIGASPSKFKSFIPVPKSPAPNCTPVNKISPSSPKAPSKGLVKTTKPLRSNKKFSK